METLSELWVNKTILKNFAIFNFIWPFYMVSYTNVVIELESVGGNLYYNLMFCSSMEIVAAFFASYCNKFESKKVICIIYLTFYVFQ